MLDTSEYKQKLEQLKAELTDRIVAVEKDLHHEEQPIEKDFAEQATQLENEQVLEALDDEAREVIAKIDSALQSIEQGTYGKCTSCGEAIAENRLSAVPYADLCMVCAVQQ